MIRHIVMWSFKEGLCEAENAANAQRIKTELEALTEQIEGVVSLRVSVSALPSGNRDILLDSLFANEKALSVYKEHPAHKQAAAFIGSVTQNRACFDCRA